MVVVQFAPLVELVRDSTKKANLTLKTLLFSFLIFIFRKAFLPTLQGYTFFRKPTKNILDLFLLKTNNIAPD